MTLDPERNSCLDHLGTDEMPQIGTLRNPATQRSKKGSEKVLERVLGKGSQKGSEKGPCYGFYSKRGL